MSVSLVIARYNESLQWVIQSDIVHHNILIYVYNKGADDLHYLNAYSNIVIHTLENVGREGHTYYTHIVNHYVHLATFVMFVQGDPFPHVSNALRRLRQCIEYAQRTTDEPRSSFHPIGEQLMLTHTVYTHDHRGLPLYEIVKFLFGVEYAGYIPFVAGAQFMVERKAIHSRTKAFYETIVDLLSISMDPLEGYAIERLHQPIFKLCSFKW